MKTTKESVACITPDPKCCNFHIHAKTVTHYSDGVAINCVRHLQLVNDQGERSVFTRITTEQLHTAPKFSLWCLERGNFVWIGGERELADLHIKLAGAPINGTAVKNKSGKRIIILIGGYATGKTMLARELVGNRRDAIQFDITDCGPGRQFTGRNIATITATGLARMNLIVICCHCRRHADRFLAEPHIQRALDKPKEILAWVIKPNGWNRSSIVKEIVNRRR